MAESREAWYCMVAVGPVPVPGTVTKADVNELDMAVPLALVTPVTVTVKVVLGARAADGVKVAVKAVAL